ncbi:glycosyltransferase family 2 protein [Cohnella suwonensis]|uniref:Glycosyltransferase family 2 protein n=1 Tax=Cohnella suwonensis TaxID=696072 RepID=A0ABW0LYV3_9BACL
MSLKIIVTMAGMGSRITRAGIAQPKYKVMARGKSLFEWSMLSLRDFFDEEFIFITRKEIYDEAFLRDRCAELGIQSYHVVMLEQLTNGQATTALMADPYLRGDDSCIIYNIDTYVAEGQISKVDIWPELDGFIPVTRVQGDHWSFVKTDDAGTVVDVAEKKPISDLATIGLYYFKSWNQYKKVYHENAENIPKENKEYYIAPMYKAFIDGNLKVGIKIIPLSDVVFLGTPKEIEAFDPGYVKANMEIRK